MHKLNYLIDSESEKDLFSSLGQLFDCRNIMKCTAENNYACVLDLATTELIVPYFKFREQAYSLCKAGNLLTILQLCYH
ncbi:hypothetical protein PR048_003726 [Dryococelus australis]|uniref:Uncharacterized protein n=1 Tax=Dryococelus australis TaxID=614101 RepID=A0ABQ9INT6_9NEOP|nr:hypothetical protein PR048_003726 [Dryococelus australis]